MNHNFFTDILPVLKHAHRYKVRSDFYKARAKVLRRRRFRGGLTDKELLFVIKNRGDLLQKEIAVRLGIGRATVSAICTGRLHKTRVDNLIKFHRIKL